MQNWFYSNEMTANINVLQYLNDKKNIKDLQ